MSDPRTVLLLAVGLGIAALVFFGPRWGLYRRWKEVRELRQRALVEDALKHFYHCESSGLVPSIDSLAGALGIGRNQVVGLLGRLEKLDLVSGSGTAWALSAHGRLNALRVVRVHRLLESYLSEFTSLHETEWHDAADRREHTLSPDDVESLAAEMGYPRFDPHGAPIPTAAGDMPTSYGEPLPGLATGDAATVARLEDEPDAIYAQLVAQGFHVGARLRVLEHTPARMRLEVDGEEQIVAPVVAANVLVIKAAAPAPRPAGCVRLSQLALGSRGRVVSIASGCRGLQRRRLLDLGLVPGTVVEAELSSLGRDPTAYRIRGALIALRRAQADQIHVTLIHGVEEGNHGTSLAV